MIVPMKKVTVICLSHDKTASLDKLAEMGVLHVKPVKKPDTQDCAAAQQKLLKVEKIIGALSMRSPAKSLKPESGLSAEALCNAADETYDKLADFTKKLETFVRDEEKLIPWGNFSWDTIAELNNKGMHVYLCNGSQEQFGEISKKHCTKKISLENGRINFVVISETEIPSESLPIALLPKNASLTQLKSDIAVLQKDILLVESQLDVYALSLKELASYKKQVEENLEFVTNRDSMGDEGSLAYIEGYVPVSEAEALIAEARKSGWALRIDDPEAGDIQVPTLLKIPKMFQMSKAIFDFIGISPGYNECDVSVFFLIFLTLFFAMLVGDAGYGLIFLAGCIYAKIKFKGVEETRITINLCTLLSIATIVWGTLNGAFFAIPAKYLPSFMHGIDYFTCPEKDQHIQFLCFVIAATHLSLARIWKAILLWNFKHSLGQLGWACFIWANFFVAVELLIKKGFFQPWVFGLYAVGFVLLVVFYLNWKEVGDIFNFPFGLIGSFVDVFSYIRLFAVGMSGAYIASSFNNMSLMLTDISPFLIVGTILILIFGHGLNIALALMGVLVHGIRLNTLEFSNHMELQWAGNKFKPFKKSNK